MKDSLDVGEMTAEMKERKWPSLGRGGVFRIYALWAERKPLAELDSWISMKRRT